MFSNVLKKFFTGAGQYENKVATVGDFAKGTQMLTQIITVIRRSNDTLLADAFGAAALMVLLVASLHLPTIG